MVDILKTKEVINKIKLALVGRNETLAIAESVTGGILQGFFSMADEAMRFYQGGITTYNLGQKTRHLGVDPILAQQVNCVSNYVCEAMAKGCSTLFKSHWGIAVTGFASPVPESNNETYAYYAIVHNNKMVRSEKIVPASASAVEVQYEYAKLIIEKFEQYLSSKAC